MPRYNLPHFNPGRMPSASELQTLVETLRDILGRLGDDGLDESPTYDGYAGAQRYIGKIVDAGPSSEADFTDARYWVTLQRLDNTAADGETDDLLISDDDTVETAGRTVCVTNLAEMTEQTHRLPVSTDTNDVQVIVYCEHDGHGKIRWFMSDTRFKGVIFAVDLDAPVSGGGDNGDSSSKATYAYVIKDLDGNVLGGTDTSPQQPRKPREKGELVARATAGQACYDSDSNVRLELAYEEYDTGPCT